MHIVHCKWDEEKNKNAVDACNEELYEMYVTVVQLLILGTTFSKFITAV